MPIREITLRPHVNYFPVSRLVFLSFLLCVCEYGVYLKRVQWHTERFQALGPLTAALMLLLPAAYGALTLLQLRKIALRDNFEAKATQSICNSIHDLVFAAYFCTMIIVQLLM